MEAKWEWLIYVGIAGLAWGTYVPIIFFGGGAFEGDKTGGRLMAILCVGAAYFVLAVVLPLILFFTKYAELPTLTTSGLVFSSLAGVAGAVGALCVVFATNAAREAKVSPAFIAPIIFGLAPLINTLVSLVWDPQKDNVFNFHLREFNPILYLGVVLVGIGAALVLYAKPSEAPKGPPATSKPSAAASEGKPGDALPTGTH